MQTVMFSRARRRARGQTMTEFALVVPVLMLLIMGVLDGALLMFSVGTARFAAAEGSRIASTLGNAATADTQAVQTIRDNVGTTRLFTVTEVDIYKLNQDGNGNLTPDPTYFNRYALDGTPMTSPVPWPPAQRNVGNGTSDFMPASSRRWDRSARRRSRTCAWNRRVTEMNHHYGRRRRRGQSLAEMAVVIPVLFFVLMGGFDATVMLADRVTGGFAVRQAARLAAELGGSQTNPNATTSQIDMQIVRNALAVARGLTSATVSEIDIYAPSLADGTYRAGDPVDQYFVNGGAVSPGTQTFPIQNRNQTPPNETSIGVRLVWTYAPPAGIFPQNMRIVEYAVMKASPLLL